MEAVEDSLQYFDETLAQFATSDSEANPVSDNDDSLVETGYTSDFTECSNPATGDELFKPSSYDSRKRRTWQPRKQCRDEEHLADLESDGTCDDLKGHTAPARTKIRTFSGQRKQREARRQRRKTGRRNSLSDSGLSLSRSDSHPSSDLSPKRRNRSKSSPAECKLNQLNKRGNESLKSKVTKSPSFIGGQNSSKLPSSKERSKNRSEKSKNEIVKVAQEDGKTKLDTKDTTTFNSRPKDSGKVTKCRSLTDISIKITSAKQEDIAAEHQYRRQYAKKFGEDKLYPDESPKFSGERLYSGENRKNNAHHEIVSKPLTVNEANIKVTHNNNQVKESEDNLDKALTDAFYTTTELKILQRVIQNAKQAEELSAKRSQNIKTPALSPPYFDHSLHKYKQQGHKTTTGSILSGLKKMKHSFAPKKHHNISAREERKSIKRDTASTKPPNALPPCALAGENYSMLSLGKPVAKKKGIFKNIFKRTKAEPKSTNKSSKRQSCQIQRDKFGSIRSIPDSLRSLWARTKSLSVQNLKAPTVKDNSRTRNSFQRSSSVTSLFGKFHRTNSILSLPGYRRGSFSKIRCGSAASLAYQTSTRAPSGFRRYDSIRSLHTGFDVITRVSGVQEDCIAPTRAGWRPSSRTAYHGNHYYEEDYHARDHLYDYDVNSQYDAQSIYYDQYHDYHYNYVDDMQDPYCPCCNNGNAALYPEKGLCYESMVAPQQQLYMNPNVARNVRSISMHSIHKQSVADLHSLDGFCHANDAIVAPLTMHVAQERRAETKKITKLNETFDTFV